MTVVSVLIPVLDEAACIERTAAAMQAQRIDGDVELLFIDGGSRDETRAILRRLASGDPRIRVLDNPARRVPNALNIGLAAARGDFVARMDAHTLYAPDYLDAGVRRLLRGDVAWVAGPQIPHGTGRWSRRVQLALETWLGSGGARYRRATDDEIEVDSGFTGVWRRDRLEALGGWDVGWPVNQDGELAARIRSAGGRIVCLPVMTARYAPRDSLAALARQYWRYGRYRAKTSHRHPESMRRSHLLAPGVAAATAAGVLPGPRAVRRAARAGVLAYGLCILGVSARAARRAGPADAAALPAVFATMHLSWGLGFFVGAAQFGIPLAAVRRVLGGRGGA